jgi:uncharacterized protein (DUF885 family)
MPTQTVANPSPLQADAVAGIQAPALRVVVAEHWEYMMRWAPTWATTLGDHRFDDQIAPRDPAAVERAQLEHAALLARVQALPSASLGEGDALTARLLRERLEAEAEMNVCKQEQWVIEAGGGSLFSEVSYLVESHVVKTPEDAANVVARMTQIGRIFDDSIANLQLGLASGRVSSREKVRRAIEQLDKELGTSPESWAMSKPEWASAENDAWPAGARARLVGELRAAIATQVTPAATRFREFLRDRVLPAARTEKEGLVGLVDGDRCYRAAIRTHVGLPMSPRELHDLGLAQIARTDRELAALGKTVLGASDLASTIAKLRTDATLYFSSGAEILAAAQTALDRANAAVPSTFSLLPKTACVMREVPAHEAPYTTIAYYRQPHYDGTKPGEYFVNTYKPETRPRFELEALTWHESVPGHHTQIAIAQELGAIPAFRKLDIINSYVEGWALYTEVLADEMGLYSSDLDRIGKVSYDAWRSSRLVVDTGIHAFGWTRSQAEAFMREHTALTETNISNEVDRYIGWPGQALSYKVGQLEILRLRDAARSELGAAFDLKAFHAVVLGAGAVSLPLLGDRVKAWVKSVADR